MSIATPPGDEDPWAIAIARHLEENLTTAGAAVTLDLTTEDTLLRKVLINRNYDMYVLRHPGQDDPDALYSFLHSRFIEEQGWQNPLGYANTTSVDPALEAQRWRHGNGRKDEIAAVQEHVTSDFPLATIAFPVDSWAIRADRYDGWQDPSHDEVQQLLSLEPIPPAGEGDENGNGDDENGDGDDENGNGDDENGNGDDDGIDDENDADDADEAEDGEDDGIDDGTVDDEESEAEDDDENGTGVDGDDRVFRVGTSVRRLLRNRNPLAVEYRRYGTLVDLLYDPVARYIDGEIQPWLAESWEWVGPERSRYPTMELLLRDELEWHDGTPLEARDVGFTYELLADTTMDEDDPVVPTPRFRGRSSLIDTVEVVDERLLRIQFVESHRDVSLRALLVPVLPEHVWEEQTGLAEIAGIDIGVYTTDALVWDNPEPIGSGPFMYESSRSDERLVLSRFDDHFLRRTDLSGPIQAYEGGPGFAQFDLQVFPSQGSMLDLLANGDLDAIFDPLEPGQVERAGENDDIGVYERPSTSFYHVGFNCQTPPFSNPNFRRAVARLIDRERLTEEVFEDMAKPAISPVADEQWVPEPLQWRQNHPLGFVGTSGEELDQETAQEQFREAGFRYDDGELLSQ